MSLQSALLLAVPVLVLLGASLSGRLGASLPQGALLRSLFPSWRFFDATEPSLSLYARVLNDEREVAPFAPLLPEQRRGWLALLFNARGNLLLAYHGLLDTLISELSERGPMPIEEVERLVSYQLVQNLVLQLLAPQPGQRQYQFKLLAQGPEPGACEEQLLSPFYPLP